MDQIGPAGASSQGFIAGAAGPILLLVVAVAVFAVPAVREFLAEYFGSVRAHYVPDPPADTAASAADASASDAEPPTSARASDRDSYDFDLGVLAAGDACDVDAPPTH